MKSAKFIRIWMKLYLTPAGSLSNPKGAIGQLCRCARGFCHLALDRDSLVSAFKVSSLPGAMGEPSNASRAAEISPREINVSARAFSPLCPPCISFCGATVLLLWKLQPLSRRRFNHRPSANWVNRSSNFFFGTLPPRAGLCRRRGRKMNNFQPLETFVVS